MKLFEGKALCSECHTAPHFTDGKFHNTGVPTEDLGRFAVQRSVELRMRPYPFFGHRKAFRTPSLRNVAQSPPYFHDGSVPRLRVVVEFYNQGGTSPDKYGRSPDVRPLNLNDREIDDLVEFLAALTTEFSMEPPRIPVDR